jgi:hypothetical protein
MRILSSVQLQLPMCSIYLYKQFQDIDLSKAGPSPLAMEHSSFDADLRVGQG